MTTPFTIRFEHGRSAMAVRLRAADDIGAGLAALDLRPPRPVIVLVGGASGLDDHHVERLRRLFTEGLVTTAVRCGATMVDGGTRSGVMRLLGEAHDAARADMPLVGVAATGTVVIPGTLQVSDDAAPLEPHHTHFVFVRGDEWGAEAPWIADVATTLAGARPSVTVLVNGGEIAYDDVKRSVAAERPVLTIAGSGRTADQFAAALKGHAADPRAVSLAQSGMIRAVPLNVPMAVGRSLTSLLEQP